MASGCDLYCGFSFYIVSSRSGLRPLCSLLDSVLTVDSCAFHALGAKDVLSVDHLTGSDFLLFPPQARLGTEKQSMGKPGFEVDVP